MSKMSDDFKNKSMLRTAVTSNAMGMADGGIAGLAGLRQRTIDGAVEGAVRPATPAPAPAPAPAAAPAPGGMISDGVVTRPAPAPVAPTPQPGIFSRLRKAVGFAAGGAVGPTPVMTGDAVTPAIAELGATGTQGLLAAGKEALAVPQKMITLANNAYAGSPALRNGFLSEVAPGVSRFLPAAGGIVGAAKSFMDTPQERSAFENNVTPKGSVLPPGVADAARVMQHVGNAVSGNAAGVFGAQVAKLTNPDITPEESRIARTAKGRIRGQGTTGSFPGMADGGTSPWDSAYAPGGSLSSRAKPQSVQSILAATLAQRNQPTAPIAPSPAATPSPELAPASPAATPMAAAPATSTQPAMGSGPMPTAGPGHEMSNSQWNQMAAGTLPSAPTASSSANWNSQQNDALRMQNSMSILQAKPMSSSLVLPNKQPGASWTPDVQNPGKTDGAAIRVGQTQYGGGLRGGGRVTGPGGPREDKVGPVMLSNGEYVLPAKTVQKLGGPEEIDEVVRATNDGREPQHADTDDRGLRHAASGLSPWDPTLGQAPGVTNGPPAYTPPPQLPPPQPGTSVATRPYEPNWRLYQAPAVDPNVIDVDPVRQSRVPPGGSPEMQAVRQAQAADQAGLRAGQAVADAKAAAQAAGPASSAAGATRGLVGKAAGLVADVAKPIALGMTAYEGLHTSTSDYAKRLKGLAPAGLLNTDAKGNIQSNGGNWLREHGYDNAGQLVDDIGVRTHGVATDLANTLAFGQLGSYFADKQAAPAAAPQGPVPGQPAVGLHRQDPNVANVIAGNVAMDRNTPDTGGAIQQTGNTFYGGVGGAQGKALEDAEAAKGRQRYQNDAAGMYAAIQGHIANGDLETANKLAWDPASRALVNQGYAARNAAMAANSRSSTPDEDALNSRYDKAADRLRGLFRSDKAQGNLAKHLTELNQQRAGELANLRNTKVQARGQDLLSEGNQARIASEQAIANQRNQFDWRKTMMEQTNKDREYQLNSAKYGTEVAKILHDQQVERETKNQSVFDTFAAKRFIGPDGKPDQAAAAEFSQFAHSSLGDVYSKPAPERDRILASAANRWEIQRNSNKAAPDGYTATTSQQLRDIKGYHKGGVEDIPQIGITGWAAGKLPFVNNDVVDFADGNSRTARSLGARDSQDIKDIVYQNQNNGLRNK